MGDEGDYYSKSTAPEPEYRRRFPPRVRQPGPPPDEDYFTLTAKHGRPHGVFEHSRQSTYRG